MTFQVLHRNSTVACRVMKVTSEHYGNTVIRRVTMVRTERGNLRFVRAMSPKLGQ